MAPERGDDATPGAPTGSSADTDFGRVESWFAALGLPARSTRPAALDSAVSTALPLADAPAVTLPPERRRAARPAGDPTPERRRASALDDGGPDSPPAGPGRPARLYAAFALSRLLLGAALLLPPWLPGLLAAGTPVPIYQAGALLYALSTAAALRTPRGAEPLFGGGAMLRRRWLLVTVGVDLLAFAALFGTLESSVNVAALFAVPVLMAATLAGRPLAQAVAALATFLQLGLGVFLWDGPDAAVRFTQTGLTCAGLFALAWLTSELTARLAREERSARSSLALARQQALLNRLVIEEMEDGILVVDRAGRVRVANPAALRLVAAPSDHRLRVFSLHDRVRWRPLLDAVTQAFRAGAWPPEGRDLMLKVPERAGTESSDTVTQDRPLRVRMRFTRRRQQELGESLCVVFLDDLRTLRLRARQDKLAAMGRVSAGIAHEIRNPLSAIAQANALLAEDLGQPGPQRLSRMIGDNVDRLRRIVDDVMAAAPGGTDATAPVIDLIDHVQQVTRDWMQTNRLPTGPQARVELGGLLGVRAPGGVRVPVRFEPDHLARVLVNLLDNALHHGSERAGAIRVVLGLDSRARADDPPELAREALHRRSGPRLASLQVASDGVPIAPDVEPLLFEPFFSTRSRGTGLGLYICRELCERHGVAMDYRRGSAQARHANVFVLRLPVVGGDEPATMSAGAA